MSWDHVSLLSKAKAIFEKALSEDRNDVYFGLLCAVGLELLARAAVSKVNIALLAAPDSKHKNLLCALGYGSATDAGISIPASLVASICTKVVKNFTVDQEKVAIAMFNRRNEELHTGSAAFIQCEPQQWLYGFFVCCSVLANHFDESLTDLFGAAEAKAAELIITEDSEKIKQSTLRSITEHRSMFEMKSDRDQNIAKEEAARHVGSLSYKRHHKVTCPACSADASVHGEATGSDTIENTDELVIVKRTILPSKFHCTACGLRLYGFAQLSVANLANYYTQRVEYAPEDYYNLINPSDIDIYYDRNDIDFGYSND